MSMVIEDTENAANHLLPEACSEFVMINSILKIGIQLNILILIFIVLYCNILTDKYLSQQEEYVACL